MATMETEQTEPETEREPETTELPDTPDVDGEPDETETGDEEADEESEQGAPESFVAPAGSDENEQAQLFDKAIRRGHTYLKAVPDILGESAADLMYCPRCVDFLPGFILPGQIRPVSDEQRIAVKQSIGELVEPSYRQDTHAQTCPDCQGEGKVLTGSKVASQRVATCKSCDGRGWVGPRAATLGQGAHAPVPGELPNLGADPEDQPAKDPWGRFKDDPLYGVMPGFERD